MPLSAQPVLIQQHQLAPLIV